MSHEQGVTTVADWRHGLLVSVRDAAEAKLVAETGVSVIDIKEPGHGPLGRAAVSVATDAITAVDGRAAITLACGELTDGLAEIAAHVADVIAGVSEAAGLVAVKAGPAGLDTLAWAVAFGRLVNLMPDGVETVAVAYADWKVALSPPPHEVLMAAVEVGARTVLVDTFDKAGPGLFGTVSQADVATWAARARKAGVALAVAGKLTAAEVPLALALGADIAGVRSAVCDGGRLGRIDRTRVFSVGKLGVQVAGSTSTIPATIVERESIS